MQQLVNLAPVSGGSPVVERGVGFFETVLLVGRRPILWESHLQRLRGSVERLELPVPKREEIEAATTQALDGQPEEGETALRLTWLAIGSDIEVASSWRLDASVRPIPQLTLRRRKGSHAISLPPEFCRDMPEFKSTSYLAAVLGLRYAARRGGDEGLFVASDGSCVEGTAAALVAWNDGRLIISDHAALPSVTAAALTGPCVDRRSLSRAILLRGALLVGSLTKSAPLLTIDGEICEQPAAMLRHIENFNRQLTEGMAA